MRNTNNMTPREQLLALEAVLYVSKDNPAINKKRIEDLRSEVSDLLDPEFINAPYGTYLRDQKAAVEKLATNPAVFGN